MNHLEQQLEFAGGKFDEICAKMRLGFIEQRKAAGWTDQEARNAFKVNEMNEEDARAKMLSELREWLKQPDV